VTARFALLALTAILFAQAPQQPTLSGATLANPADVIRMLPAIAKAAEATYKTADQVQYLDTLFRLQLVAGDYDAALSSIASLRQVQSGRHVAHTNILDADFELYADAKRRQQHDGIPIADAFAQAFQAQYVTLSDLDAVTVGRALTHNASSQRDWLNALDALKSKNTLDSQDAIALAVAYAPYALYSETSDTARRLVREDADHRYVIDDHAVIKTKDGTLLSSVIVRKRGSAAKLPAAFTFTIYADPPSDVQYSEYAAARGYAGVVAYTRGKGASPGPTIPYEDDGRDADSVIQWITQQPWSDGRVGMYGGSYDGFTPWAAAKHAPPALKTIVPYAAQNPGNGLPVENNVFLFVNYAWIYYVTDNKYMDDAAYADPELRALNNKWWVSGRSYRDIPRLSGRPNPWLLRWLQHPSFDSYWQAMVPYREDFAHINIPVLTITGYYDDGQGSALNYLKDHYRYNPRASHYLVIGPYDHLGTQRAHKDDVLRGYPIDPVAQYDTPQLTFDWFDYILRGAKKPALLQDRINYEVMGANVWRHAASIAGMANERRRFYLTARKYAHYYALSTARPQSAGALPQQVNFADRKTANNDSYPFPILGKKPDLSNGYAFVTPPFRKTISIDGFFSGRIKAIINKRDFDIGLALYQILPDRRLMELSYFTGRASYARDITTRRLLHPGKVETISFDRSRLVSRQLEPGSRLLLTLNVNKNQFAEINYGTGKDVSSEDIRDAKVPLRVKWLTDSYVEIPVWR